MTRVSPGFLITVTDLPITMFSPEAVLRALFTPRSSILVLSARKYQYSSPFPDGSPSRTTSMLSMLTLTDCAMARALR